MKIAELKEDFINLVVMKGEEVGRNLPREKLPLAVRGFEGRLDLYRFQNKLFLVGEGGGDIYPSTE